MSHSDAADVYEYSFFYCEVLSTSARDQDLSRSHGLTGFSVLEFSVLKFVYVVATGAPLAQASSYGVGSSEARALMIFT